MATHSVWRKTLQDFGEFAVELPAGARLLCVARSAGVPWLFAEVDQDLPLAARRFAAVREGHPIPEGAAYIGSSIDPTRYADSLHYFELAE